MRGAKKIIFSVTLAIVLSSVTACVSVPTESSYYPGNLWQLTSCDAPLILRHKTKAEITPLDKENRLITVGLNPYDGSSKGRDLSGAPITYFDSLTKGEDCPQKDITTHYVTSIADLKSYAENRRDIRPIYVRHLRSLDIERDKDIQCEGVFNNGEQELRDRNLTMPVYNDELCWLVLRGANE